jgi:CelD/BcsL family acetyltransferase involved in cellulose biosynthesis
MLASAYTGDDQSRGPEDSRLPGSATARRARTLADAGSSLLAGGRARPVAPAAADRPGDDRYEVTRLASHTALLALRPEWEELHAANTRQHPFSDPGWLLAWARTYIPRDDDLWVVTVRRDGRLVGVVPCYLARVGRGPVEFRSVQLFGCLIRSGLTEVPRPLTHPGDDPRGIVRTALRFLVDRAPADAGAHWLEIILGDEVPWLEPQWFRATSTDQHPPTIITATPRAVVTLPLPAAPAPLALKRNVKESVRRARNRLTKTGKPWSVKAVTAKDEIDAAFDTLRSLHSARSNLAGKEAHADSLSADAGQFLHEAVVDLAEHGRAAIYQLELDGVVIASQLVLTTPHASYLSVSGLSAEAWEYSPMALIIHTAATDAIARGASRLHLSAGPDEAKLRWSEQVDFYPLFVIVPTTPAARLAYGLYSPLSVLARYNRLYRLHTIRDS